MSQASNVERQMLDLINSERAKAGLQPVQLELRLNDSLEDHSEWMLERNIFSHTGVGGSSAGERMEDAGFQFSGNWTWAENIAWQSERGAPGIADDVADLHEGLMNSPGHRANILNPDVTVIGIGIERGNFNGWDAVMVTQNFARTAAPVQIDNGAGGGTATNGNDLLSLSAPGLLLGLAGNDTLVGTSGRDTLNGGRDADRIEARQGADRLVGAKGNDTMFGGAGEDTLFAGRGDDLLLGGEASDRLFGADGTDTLNGGTGNDLLRGGGGRDRLNGEAGNDRLEGGVGRDTLDGGAGRDTLDGGTNRDLLFGRGGSDTFVFSVGRSTVMDFDVGGAADQIDLSEASGIGGFADLRTNHLEQVGANAVITDQRGDELILRNFDISDLRQDDFLF